MIDLSIELSPKTQSWWYHFSKDQVEICSIGYLRHQAKQGIPIFGITVYEEDIPLPEPNETPPKSLGKEKIPMQLTEFLDVFDASRAEMLPQYEELDYAIDTEEGKIPPYRAIYSLSHTKLQALWDYI